MSKGTVYKKGEVWRVRFTAPNGDRVDRPAHVASEREARQLLGTLTALAGLCRLYAVPFDPDDTLADIAHELDQARQEVERVFGAIRCPHCSRRVVPEWRPAALGKPVQARRPATPPAPQAPLESLEKLTDRIAHDIVQAVAAPLRDEIRKTLADALGPRKVQCCKPRCSEPAFVKGLCKRHYYHAYHEGRAKQVKRRKAVED